MDYILKANGLVIILFLFYNFFLKKETFFKSIRSYFLIGLLLVVAIPLIEIPIYAEQVATKLSSINYSNLSLNNFKNSENSINWIQLGSFIYILGVGVFTAKFLIQLISLGNLLSKYKFIKQGNYYFVETSNSNSPFSFFNVIIYNKAQFTIDELEQIINHEKAHVFQWHTVDTLLAHLLVITLWFNPFVWLYKKAVQQNLEFLADEYALKLTQNHQLYQFTLLKTCSKTYCTSITNNFYNSLIKKRILMLQKKRSKNKSQWKYALLLPLITAFIITFNTKTIAQEKKLVEAIENQKNFVEIINKDFQKSDLELVKKRLKVNGVEFNYNNLKFNNNNEIIKISLKIKNETGKATATWDNKNNPIPTIYVGENDGQLIASSSSLNKNKTYSSYKKRSNGDVKFLSKKDLKNGDYLFVTSDGDKKTWTSKGDKKEHIIFFSNDSNDTIKTEKIIIKGTGEKVWVQEKDNNEKMEIKIINDEDNASENVFVIKSDSNNNEIDAKPKKPTFLMKSDGDLKPLYYVDGKLITPKEMEAINPDTIKSMNVLKGEKATEKYGEKGENGVIEITTKKN